MKHGSITVFCALCMMLIASVLFVLLESGRVYGLDFYAGLKSEAGIDSVCAEYQPLLWQQYGLLALDGAYGTEHFSCDYVLESLTDQVTKSCQTDPENVFAESRDCFGLSLKGAELTGYALLTDEDGKLFLGYLAERMKEELPLGIAEDIYEAYQDAQMLGEQSDTQADIDAANQTLASAKASKWREIQAKMEQAETEEEENTAKAEASVFNTPEITLLDTIFGGVKNAQESGTLQLILEEGKAVSVKESKSDLQTRKKETGTLQLTKEADWYQKLLVLAYLDEYFSCYQKKKEGHYLSYEMEYVLCGKDTEWENLEGTFKRMLLMREAANILSVLRDSEKLKTTQAMAEVIGLLIGENPAAVKLIQAGLVGAWAYAESILDVRSLAAGEKIPLIKEKNEWTTEISQILSVFQNHARAKKCEDGLNYNDYLKQLLFLSSEEETAYRMMEAMEFSLQAVDEYENCKMNQMFAVIRCCLVFEGNPVFSSLMTIGNEYSGKFQFIKEVERSYIP